MELLRAGKEEERKFRLSPKMNIHEHNENVQTGFAELGFILAYMESLGVAVSSRWGFLSNEQVPTTKQAQQRGPECDYSYAVA